MHDMPSSEEVMRAYVIWYPMPRAQCCCTFKTPQLGENCGYASEITQRDKRWWQHAKEDCRNCRIRLQMLPRLLLPWSFLEERESIVIFSKRHAPVAMSHPCRVERRCDAISRKAELACSTFLWRLVVEFLRLLDTTSCFRALTSGLLSSTVTMSAPWMRNPVLVTSGAL